MQNRPCVSLSVKCPARPGQTDEHLCLPITHSCHVLWASLMSLKIRSVWALRGQRGWYLCRGSPTSPPEMKQCFASQAPIKRWTWQQSQPRAVQDAPSQSLLLSSSPGWAHANRWRSRVETGLVTKVCFKGKSPKTATGRSAEDPVDQQHHWIRTPASSPL